MNSSREVRLRTSAENFPIVIMASACWETPSPVNCHQIARRFAQRGHRVLFVESTGLRGPAMIASGHDRQRVLRRITGWLRGPRPVDENLFVVSPIVLPWNLLPWLRPLSMRWLAWQIRAAIRKLDLNEPVLWSFLPTYLTALRRIPARRTIYHCVDRYSANPGVDSEWLESLERSIVNSSDFVFATSRNLQEELEQIRRPIHLFENVADVDLFRSAVTKAFTRPEEYEGLQDRIVIHVGNLANYRTNYEFLVEAAEKLPKASFVFIGVTGLGDPSKDDEALTKLRQLPNVHLLGPKPPTDLPRYLHFAHAALIPALDNGHTRGSLPLKFWEYIAAGLPVVATDLPNFRGLDLGDALYLVKDAADFVSKIEKASHETASRRTASFGNPFRLLISNHADGHDWNGRIEELNRLLEEPDP